MSYIFWKLSPTAFRLFAKCTQLTHLLCQFNLYCIYLTNITAQCKCLQRPQKSHRLSDSWPFLASPHLKMYFFLLEKIVPGSAGCISLLVRPRNSTWSKPSSVLRLLGMATFFDDHKVCLFVISPFYRNQVYLGSNLWVLVSLTASQWLGDLFDTLLMWLWLMKIPIQEELIMPRAIQGNVVIVEPQTATDHQRMLLNT